MTSSFAARRLENVESLFTEIVERLIGVAAGPENLGIAHNYCLYHTRHHSFPDPDPVLVRREVDALRERLGIHAQLEKQRGLDMLVGRLMQTPGKNDDVPDVKSAVLLLLMRLSGNPLQTRYTQMDAARVVGGVGLRRTNADDAEGMAGATTSKGARDESDNESDDESDDEDEDAKSVGTSESTLSDWSDDEDAAARRAETLRSATAAAAARAKQAKQRDASGTDHHRPAGLLGTKMMNTEKDTPPDTGGFSWRTLGNSLDAAEAEAGAGTNLPARQENGHCETSGRFVSSAPPPPRRNGAGETVVTDASRLFPALIAARGDDLALNVLAASAGHGASASASASGMLASLGAVSSRQRRTEAYVVGTVLHAMHGVAPVDGTSGPVSVPHLSPAALAGALAGAREAATALDATRRLARATLDPNSSSGPTLRAAAAAVARIERDIRDQLAPLVLRAAGLRAASTRGAPTLLELRTSARLLAARALGLRALADAVLTFLSSPVGFSSSGARAASHCLDTLRRAAASRQTSASDDGQGFVDAARLFCAVAQPYLAALHRWVAFGVLEDPSGEFFVCEGPGVRELPGTEAHWQSGYVVRRGRLGEPECPEFLRGRAEELLVAGKTAGLLRARGPPAFSGRRGRGKAGETTNTPPTSLEHLGVTFCVRVRAALEASTAISEEFSTETTATPSRAVVVVAVADRGSLVAPLAPIARVIGGDETTGGDTVFATSSTRGALLLEAAATTRLVAFVGDAGAASTSTPTSSSAAALDSWLRDSPTPRSLATAPFAAVCVAAAVDPARDRAKDLSRALMARLRGAWGLGAHVRALRAAYLGGAGEATATFSRVVHARLDAAEARAADGVDDVGDETDVRLSSLESALDRAELEAAFCEAAAADQSQTLPDPSAVSLEILPAPDERKRDERSANAKETTNSPYAQLDALARVRLRVQAPWPLALVVPARAAEGYGACHAFLAQLRRARAATETHATRAWTSATRRDFGGGGGGVVARQLALETRHFVAAMHDHVLCRVLETSWVSFQKELGRAETLDAARDAHAVFLDATCRQCLVSPDPTWTLLKGQAMAALVAACDLASLGARADRLAYATSFENTPCASVPEHEAEEIAKRFRRARSYILRVVDSKLKIGAFPELHELRSRLDFNGFYLRAEGKGGVGGEEL